MLFSYLLIYIGLPQPWSARIYNFQSIPWTICNKEYSYFCSKQKGINQWHICACILNFTIYLRHLQCKLTQSYYIRKPNEPQYQEHTFLQESSSVSDLETCVMWTQNSQLITLSRNNIDNRKSVFLLSESNENTEVRVNLNYSTEGHFTLFCWFKSCTWQNKSSCAIIQKARGSLSINKRGGYNLAMQNAHPFRSKKELF